MTHNSVGFIFILTNLSKYIMTSRYPDIHAYTVYIHVQCTCIPISVQVIKQ